MVRLGGVLLDPPPPLGSVVFLKSLFLLYSFNYIVSLYDPVEFISKLSKLILSVKYVELLVRSCKRSNPNFDKYRRNTVRGYKLSDLFSIDDLFLAAHAVVNL